jgi:hypothetical protein
MTMNPGEQHAHQPTAFTLPFLPMVIALVLCLNMLSPGTSTIIVYLLNMHLCLALHLFDDMPDRPSSRLFLVVAMPHAPPPQIANALCCRPSSRAFSCRCRSLTHACLSPRSWSTEGLWPICCLIAAQCFHATRVALLCFASLSLLLAAPTLCACRSTSH